MSEREREDIASGIAEKLSGVDIARRLGRNASVVNREIARNGGRNEYRPVAAQRRAGVQRSRPKGHKLETEHWLHAVVVDGLAENWSPQQIAKRLKIEYPDDEAMRVSHETIYQTLFLQARGALRTELKVALRTGRARRVPHGSTRAKQARIRGMVNISERPAEATDRAVPGHWEGDLILGAKNKTAVATLVERSTGYLQLVKLHYDHTAERVASRLATEIKKLPEMLHRSLTWDQGVEMADHQTFTLATDIPVFFCDPHSPWQRGTNENTNGLVRQYLPKGTDLSIHTQADLDTIARQINGRPRQRHNWLTPAEKLAQMLPPSDDALTD